jgi:hypothetical protein
MRLRSAVNGGTREFGATTLWTRVALMFLLAFTAGCATIMNGSRQNVALSSSPTGAQVTVNGVTLGTTPMVTGLKRRDTQLIRISMEGYEPFELGMTRSVSGWVWGNIIFGGFIGLGVDAVSGGLYKLSPEQVTAQLQRSDVEISDAGEDGLVLMMLMRPSPGMELVGTLQRQ